VREKENVTLQAKSKEEETVEEEGADQMGSFLDSS